MNVNKFHFNFSALTFKFFFSLLCFLLLRPHEILTPARFTPFLSFKFSVKLSTMSSEFLLGLAMHTSGIKYIISLASEIFLLLLIIFKTRASFGPYKYLMIVYNVVLIMYSTATTNANLAAHSTETSYVLFRMYNGPDRTLGPLLIRELLTSNCFSFINCLKDY